MNATIAIANSRILVLASDVAVAGAGMSQMAIASIRRKRLRSKRFTWHLATWPFTTPGGERYRNRQRESACSGVGSPGGNRLSLASGGLDMETNSMRPSVEPGALN